MFTAGLFGPPPVFRGEGRLLFRFLHSEGCKGAFPQQYSVYCKG